jgi:endonuclease/exonuclease/phosphatase family metal-dependent hydrolase
MLRVMSLNHWFTAGDWHARRKEICAWINHLEPDVVCLQEVLATPDGSQNTAEWIAENAAGEWHVAHTLRDVYQGAAKFGNAILSRWPIDETHDRDLYSEPEGRGDEVQRCVLHAKTNNYDIFCTHLVWSYLEGYIREKEVVELDDFIKEHASAESPIPPVLCGDFNAEPDSTEIRFLTGGHSLEGKSTWYQDAWRVAPGKGDGYTWDNRNTNAAVEREPDRRIDYIFSGWSPDRPKGAGRIAFTAVVCDRALTGAFASDHFGLFAEIEVP